MIRSLLLFLCILGVTFSSATVHAQNTLRVDTYPAQITKGDNLEIVGTFPSPGGNVGAIQTYATADKPWPGRLSSISVDGTLFDLISWSANKIIVSTSEPRTRTWANNFRQGLNTFRVVTDNEFSNSFDISVKILCTTSSWSCDNWNTCSAGGVQTRICKKSPWTTYNSEGATQNYCEDGVPSPETSQSCTYTQPVCTSWTYSDWSECQSNYTRTRSVISSSPSDCSGGKPEITQSCAYIPPCTADAWSCGNWSSCSTSGSQTRTCFRTLEACSSANITPPTTSQSCTPPAVYQPSQPSCTADTWSCGEWNACSLSGVQNRSCRKTFDCPSVESAPPAIDQYCESPNRPIQQVPQVPQSSDEISNQDSIVRATVKLICPVDSNRASQGSGTLINSNGTILTNKHVVERTLGCIVGFVDNFSDEPYFGERQIADIVKMSSSEDVAVLKIRNPQNTSLPYTNIAIGSSKNLRLGTKIITYGYPSKFGTNITYTSGDFSGTNGNYLKTTAIIEHGNSGGGAYLKDGTFIGVPSAVIRGELNALGYVLSINAINAWLGNSSVISDSRPNNNYSRVSSVLETLDLNRLDSLQLVIPNTVETKKEPAPQVTAPAKISKPATPKLAEQTQKNISNPIPNKSAEQKVVENKKPKPAVVPEKQEKPKKASLPKRFLFWLANLF